MNSNLFELQAIVYTIICTNHGVLHTNDNNNFLRINIGQLTECYGTTNVCVGYLWAILHDDDDNGRV